MIWMIDERGPMLLKKSPHAFGTPSTGNMTFQIEQRAALKHTLRAYTTHKNLANRSAPTFSKTSVDLCHPSFLLAR
jgi:hypothetical protein